MSVVGEDGVGKNGEEKGHLASPRRAQLTAHPPTPAQVSVVIPSIDEHRNLHILLPRIAADYEVIVVEGRDLDTTRQLVAQLRPTATVIGQSRSGKGNALMCGCAAAQGDYLVMLDADGSADPAEIPRFIAALDAGADVARGSRYLPLGGSDDLTMIRSLGNRALTLATNLLFGTRFSDLCYGYNAFTRHMIAHFELPDPAPQAPTQWGDGFEIETLFSCRAAASRCRITEVPSYEYARIHGTSNLHAWRDGRRVLRTILTEWWRYLRHVA